MEQRYSFTFSIVVACSAILMCTFQISSEITSGTATRRPALDNKIQNVRMLWQCNRSRAHFCLGECVRDDRCASLFYNKMTGQCQGHSITFGIASFVSDIHTMENFRYYVCKHGEKYIGDSCELDDDCLTPNSKCMNEMCQCTPGYSFSPKTHDCKVCYNYGSNFWEIRDHYISAENVETVTEKTLEECFDMCVARTDYTCTSLEYGRTSKKCYLSNITVLDHPDRWYSDSASKFNISYYQRDCE